MDWQREHSPDFTRPVMPAPGQARPVGAGQPDPDQVRLWLDHAVNHLRRNEPGLSSAHLLVSWQVAFLAAVIAGLAIGFIAAPHVTISFVFAAMAGPFLCVVAIRTLAIAELCTPPPDKNSQLPLCATDDPLPCYAVLVPLYQEAEVVPALLDALAAIDYPEDRLEISLVVENGDGATRAALARHQLPSCMRVVCVPDGEPRTKPRAINYALASARGDYVVVYDAEDIPEPDQLLRALSVFRSAGANLGCVQARLNTYNPNDTFFTRGILAQTHQT